MATDTTTVTVEATVNAPLEKAWEYWTTPSHIMEWNNASEDWFTPKAENDLQTGGKFIYRMEAKDGSFAFDFEGTYEEVKPTERLVYLIADGRKVTVTFSGTDKGTTISEAFETESMNPVEMQEAGWQAILNNFKKYVEAQ